MSTSLHDGKTHVLQERLDIRLMLDTLPWNCDKLQACFC